MASDPITLLENVDLNDYVVSLDGFVDGIAILDMHEALDDVFSTGLCIVNKCCAQRFVNVDAGRVKMMVCETHSNVVERIKLPCRRLAIIRFGANDSAAASMLGEVMRFMNVGGRRRVYVQLLDSSRQSALVKARNELRLTPGVGERLSHKIRCAGDPLGATSVPGVIEPSTIADIVYRMHSHIGPHYSDGIQNVFADAVNRLIEMRRKKICGRIERMGFADLGRLLA